MVFFYFRQYVVESNQSILLITLGNSFVQQF